MNSLVPAAGDGFDVTGSLDDLLPSSAPQDRSQPLAAPPPTGDSDIGPAPEPAAPEPPRELTPADITELSALHDEVNAASAASESLSFTGRGRRRLRAAMQAEDDALRQFGFASHSEFVFATQAGGFAPPPPEDIWGAPEREVARETLASLNVVETSFATAPSAEPEPVPEPEPEPEPVPDPDGAELEAARLELARAHDERQQAEAERDVANAQRHVSDEEHARARAELEALAARCRQADSEAEEARRKLTDTETELERIRAELAGVSAVTVTDDDALARIRAESEQELDRIRTLAGREIEDLAAKLNVFEEETGRVAAELAENHRQELQRLEADLQAAADAAAQAGADAVDATRSRDAAIDEIARHRVELEKVRSELGTARADVTRLESEREAAMGRMAEAEAAAGAAREDSERDFVRLDAVAKQQEAEIAELRAQLGQASTDTNAIALAHADLAKAGEDLEVMRRERAAASEAAQHLQSDLESARHDLEVARTDAEAARAESDLVRAEVSALETVIQELETRAAEDEPTRELRRLVEVAQELAEGTGQRTRPRGEAEQELADLEARVADLRTKRRRVKKRLEREQEQLRHAEVSRDRVRHETEALAARIATEAASVLDDALRQRSVEQRARQAEIDQAAKTLAAVESGIESVVLDASTLRTKLTSMRADLDDQTG